MAFRALDAFLMCLALPVLRANVIVNRVSRAENGELMDRDDMERPSSFSSGVPIYNLAAATSKRGGKKSTSGQTWNVYGKKTASDDFMMSLCKKAHNGRECQRTSLGHHDGVQFLTFKGTMTKLEEVLSKGGRTRIDSAETNMMAKKEGGSLAQSGENRWSWFQSQTENWGLKHINLENAPRNRGKGVNIFIVDSGIRHTHSDFGGRAKVIMNVASSKEWDADCKLCLKGDRQACGADGDGHGTHCASVAGGKTYGVASEANLLGVKVLWDQDYGDGWEIGTGYMNYQMHAFDWIAMHAKTLFKGPAVLSFSIGTLEPAHVRGHRLGIFTLTRKGVIVIVAAGNESDDGCRYSPAFVTQAITVAAVDSSNKKPYFTNYGECINLYAPGNEILAAGHNSDDDLASHSGSSMACPFVAGAAAILLEKYPWIKWRRLRGILPVVTGTIPSDIGAGENVQLNFGGKNLRDRRRSQRGKRQQSQHNIDMGGGKKDAKKDPAPAPQ